MKELLDNLILRWGHDPANWPNTQGVYLAGMMLAGVALTTFGAIFAGLLSWWERRVAARIQSRIGPYFVMTGFVLTFVVLPFGYRLSPSYMNVGLFYVVSITALIVVGILISGWASNSKWALFGGIRAAAQVVSYEIPAGMVILVPILMAGSLN